MVGVVKSYEPGEKPTIRGKIVTATAVLYVGPTVRVSRDIEPKWFPPQPNNMVAWIRAAYKTLGADLRVLLGAQDELEYLVNNGEGSKVGRGSNDNLYSYLLKREGSTIQRLDIRIRTIDHAKAYKEKRDRGHIPKPRANWQGVSHWRPGIKEYRVWVIDDFALMTEPEFEERFPQWVGKMPIHGHHDPENYRNMPQPSFYEDTVPADLDDVSEIEG